MPIVSADSLGYFVYVAHARYISISKINVIDTDKRCILT